MVLGFAIAAACLVLGAKLAMIEIYGSDVPYMDEWDAVGRVLLLPHAAGDLSAANFLEPQNEHRIVLARLVAYALAISNRQWDARLEMTAGAVIHSCFCAALLLLARRYARGFRFTVVALVITSLFVLAFDWENTLQGIQFQFYLLEWSALGTFLLCLPSEPLSGRWWAGFLVGMAGLGTMASGFFAPAVVIAAMSFRSIIQGRLAGRSAVGIGLLLVVCVAGYLSVKRLPGSDWLAAHSVGEWLRAAVGALSWPMAGWPIAFVILQLPLCLLLAGCIRRRAATPEETLVLAIGLWTWLQVAAIATGRATHGLFLSARYSDLYAVGAFANVLALALLWASRARARWLGALAGAWLLLFSWGLGARTREAHSVFLDDFPHLKEMERRHIRSFLATHDLAQLQAADPRELPYPRADILGSLLLEPGIASYLPVGVRPAVSLAPDPKTTGFEVAPGVAASPRTWTARQGPALFVSQPFPYDVLPFLRIEVSGSPGLDASLLRLEATDVSVPARPFPLQGGAWHAADLAVPGGSSVRLVAEVPTGDHSFSFTEPVEMGAGSWMDRGLLRRARLIQALSGALYACLLGAILFTDLGRSPRVKPAG